MDRRKECRMESEENGRLETKNETEIHPNDHIVVVARVQQHLQAVVVLHSVLFPHFDGRHHDVVNLLRCRRLGDHSGARKPREEDGGGRGAAIDLVIELSKTRDDCRVVGYFRTG